MHSNQHTFNVSMNKQTWNTRIQFSFFHKKKKINYDLPGIPSKIYLLIRTADTDVKRFRTYEGKK